MLQSNCEFCEFLLKGLIFLWRVQLNFSHMFRQIWIKFNTGCVNKNLSFARELCENRNNESHTFLTNVNELVSLLHTFIIRIRRNAQQKSQQNSINYM